MGMFDYVRCEVPLPDGWESGDLQTKGFDCEMVVHIITKDGRLLFEQIDRTEIVPKEERPYPDAPEGSLQAMCGIFRTFKSQRESNFHGVMNFYGLEVIRREPDERYGPQGRPIYKSHEYYAKFTDGRLVGITTEDPSATQHPGKPDDGR